MRVATFVVVLMMLGPSAAPPAPPLAPPVREIAARTYLLPGAMLPDRGPDGNTVMVIAPEGLVVVDTGRHPWHSDAILAFAAARRLPVAAIVNTHWHLDHASGNGRLKAAHPGARVYTTTAVDRALGPGGFLARAAAAARAQIPDPAAPPTRAEETALFLRTMDTPATLRPDVAVTAAATLRLGGRPFALHVAADAVTEADLWLYDAASGVAVLGDLITLPAPFFETACPAPWERALDAALATPFRLAVPGHGPVMSRDDVQVYRRAFASFRACVATDGSAATCAAAWSRDVARFLASDEERRQATAYASYYVELLRRNGGASQDCRQP